MRKLLLLLIILLLPIIGCTQNIIAREEFIDLSQGKLVGKEFSNSFAWSSTAWAMAMESSGWGNPLSSINSATSQLALSWQISQTNVYPQQPVLIGQFRLCNPGYLDGRYVCTGGWNNLYYSYASNLIYGIDTHGDYINFWGNGGGSSVDIRTTQNNWTKEQDYFGDVNLDGIIQIQPNNGSATTYWAGDNGAIGQLIFNDLTNTFTFTNGNALSGIVANISDTTHISKYSPDTANRGDMYIYTLDSVKSTPQNNVYKNVEKFTVSDIWSAMGFLEVVYGMTTKVAVYGYSPIEPNSWAAYFDGDLGWTGTGYGTSSNALFLNGKTESELSVAHAQSVDLTPVYSYSSATVVVQNPLIGTFDYDKLSNYSTAVSQFDSILFTPTLHVTGNGNFSRFTAFFMAKDKFSIFNFNSYLHGYAYNGCQSIYFFLSTTNGFFNFTPSFDSTYQNPYGSLYNPGSIGIPDDAISGWKQTTIDGVTGYVFGVCERWLDSQYNTPPQIDVCSVFRNTFRSVKRFVEKDVTSQRQFDDGSAVYYHDYQYVYRNESDEILYVKIVVGGNPTGCGGYGIHWRFKTDSQCPPITVKGTWDGLGNLGGYYTQTNQTFIVAIQPWDYYFVDGSELYGCETLVQWTESRYPFITGIL